MTEAADKQNKILATLKSMKGHGHVDADMYAEILIALGKRYNVAWLGN